MKMVMGLSLFLVLLVAGCILDPVSGYGGGVVIETFDTPFSEVYSGEPVGFRLKVRNTGTRDASSIMPVITGLDDWVMKSDTCMMGWDTLGAADPSIGSAGGTENCEWTYFAPEVPKGLTSTYSPAVRLYYGYSSSMVKNIMFASSEELRLMKDSGQTIPVQTASQTSGPVQIDIETQNPIRFWGGMVTFPLKITIKNSGGGVVCPSVSDCEAGQNLNKISLDLSSSGDISFSDCEVSSIDLWQGKENILVCQATFSGLSDQETAQRTILINADYGYYVDSETTVRVTKRID